ncbi:hypothetical protein C5167_030845 [Papaver somniferum]|nr:hypothetical protein C5167_030845 [Papaver somniferum]
MGEEGGKLVSSSTEKRSERNRPPLPNAAPWLVFPYKVKDKLYLMCGRDQHLEIDKGKLWDNDDDSLTLRAFVITNNTGYYPWRGSDHIDSIDFFVESSVELFKVEINFNMRQNMKVFNSVVVWRLDFASKELKVVTCLGDHVLLIGKNTRACCSTSKLGLTSGCLYYTLPEDQVLYKFEVQSSGNYVICRV